MNNNKIIKDKHKERLDHYREYFKNLLKENPPKVSKHKSMVRQILLGMKLVEIEMKDMSVTEKDQTIDDIFNTLHLYEVWMKKFF